MKSQRKDSDFEYDVCLSYAGEDRAYVDEVARYLNEAGVRVFYDRYESVNLWGKDLYTHLDKIYKSAAKYCILFASKHYAKKVWTNRERISAQERALQNHTEYILPARFDTTEIPGLNATISYIDLKEISPDELSKKIIQKIGPRKITNFLPANPDKFLEKLNIKSEEDTKKILSDLNAIVRALSHMDETEKTVLFIFIFQGCHSELPKNVHIDKDLLRRFTDIEVKKLSKILKNLKSLGFKFSEGPVKNHSSDMFVIEFRNMSSVYLGNATLILVEAFKMALKGCCFECGKDNLMRADFSNLSSASETVVIDPPAIA